MSGTEGKPCKDSAAGIDLQLISRLRECGHFLHYKTGEKGGQRRILIKILAHGSLTQRQLQELMKLSSGAISEILAKMEAEGLITRVKSEGDKRQVELTLTDCGRESAIRLVKADAQLARQLFSVLSASEKEELAGLLKKLLAGWNAMVIEDGKE